MKTAIMLLPFVVALSGCARNAPEPQKRENTFAFRDQKLPFQYERGESGAAWPVETTGGGVGLLDFDGDGDLDVFFAQGVPLPVGSSKNPMADVLLENRGDGRFDDVKSIVVGGKAPTVSSVRPASFTSRASSLQLQSISIECRIYYQIVT